jgi:Phage tail tube protein, GTA-gp10
MIENDLISSDSGDGSIIAPFGGERRKFRLGIGQLRELQSVINGWRIKLGAQPIGPNTFFHLLRTGDAWHDEIRAVIKLGLQGAGMPEPEIIRLIDRYIDRADRLYLTDYGVILAAAIFGKAFEGAPDDPAGKKPAGEPATSPSASPSFTDSDAPSATTRDRSIN